MHHPYLDRVAHWTITGFFLTIMASLGGSQSILLNLVFFIISSGIVITCGELILLRCNFQVEKTWMPIAAVIGISIFSIAMLPLVFFLHASAGTAFISIACAILIYGFYKRHDLLKIKTTSNNDFIIFTLLTLIVGFGVHITAASIPTLYNTGSLPAWSDYYIHGVTLNCFGSEFSIGRGDPTLVDTPLGFYHYASFMLPAAAMILTGLSGAAAATSLLLPLGLLAGILGLYALATQLGGRLTGSLFIAVFLCLPTPATLSNVGMYDFYWLLFLSPGAGYAIGLSSIAIISFISYTQDKSPSLAILTITLTLSIILVRVHMFLLTAPILLATLFIHLFPQWRKIFFTAISLFSGFIAIILAASSDANKFWIMASNPHEYMDFVLSSNLYYQKLNHIVSTYIHHGLLATQILIILFSTFGFFLFLFPILHVLHIKRFSETAIDWLPWMLIITFIFLTLFAPIASNGDFSEYRQRHFILAYPLLAIFSTYLFLCFYYKKKNIPENTPIQLSLIACTTLFVTAFTWTHNLSRPMITAMPWSNDLFEQKISLGVKEAATYLKLHSKKGDIFATNSEAAFPSLKSPAIEIASLTGLSSYISRTELLRNRSAETQKIFTHRKGLTEQIGKATDWPTVQNILQENGIRWFVYFNEKNPGFDLEKRFPVFKLGNVAIYESTTTEPQDLIRK